MSWLLVVHRRRQESHSEHPADSEWLDTVQAWPPQAVRVMTLPERLAFDTLRRALPRHLVLAQVPLSRFISVPSRHSYSKWLSRAGRLNVDLLVCDASSRVLAAVEVRSPHDTTRSAERHERLASVLKAAGVTVHVWLENALPSTSAVRQLFKAKADTAAPELDGLGDNDRRFLPMPEIREVLMEGDAFSYNASNEPVSSGYFDDLDTATSAHSARG
ncbi:MAG: DUF2726 domain-containing protein [Rhizobacter sp.]|nr:DUF2726 domain-containing protein [Rhizobacter sp.]